MKEIKFKLDNDLYNTINKVSSVPVEQLIEEVIIDLYDSIKSDEAIKEFEADPVTYTLEEAWQKLGI